MLASLRDPANNTQDIIEDMQNADNELDVDSDDEYDIPLAHLS